MEMETCIRGFSFMTDKKGNEVMDMQFIEGSELERAWKTSRRQRQKEQEKKIWDEFVKEQDVVQSLFKDDPYQFVDHLPEENIKELLECEKIKVGTSGEIQEKENGNNGFGYIQDDESQHSGHQVVTFAEPRQSDDQTIFFFYDDGTLVAEDQMKDESSRLSSCTVRECTPRERNASTHSREDLDKRARKEKSKIIENTVYCDKVSDLRWKINETLLGISVSLENRWFINVEPETIPKMKRRSSEFSARFTRIHLYQLKKQLNDISRNNAMALPFAKHTQFQSQMVRIVSLHQNMLNSLQLFHKTLEHTPCLRDGVVILNAISQLVRDVSVTCDAVSCPQGYEAMKDLYNDNILSTIEMLHETLTEYSQKIEEFLSSSDNLDVDSSPTKNLSGKKNQKKQKFGSIVSSSRSKSNVDNRLSMYSMGSYKFNSERRPIHTIMKRQKKIEESELLKSAGRSRRPLMRDPHEGQPKACRTQLKEAEGDITTMVEAFGSCASSRNSFCGTDYQKTPMSTSRSKQPASPQSLLNTIIGANPTPNNSQVPTPRNIGNTAKGEVITKENATSTTLITQTDMIAEEKRSAQNNKVSTPRNRNYYTRRNTDVASSKSKVAAPRNNNKRKDSFKKQQNCDNVNTAELSPRIIPYTSPKENQPPHKILVQCVPKGCIESLKQDAGRKEFGIKSVGTPREMQKVTKHDATRSEKDAKLTSQADSGDWAVTQLLQKICALESTGSREDRTHGAKNAKLHCITSSTPRQPLSTPELLRILEETIEKKPLNQHQKKNSSNVKDLEKLRMTFNIPEKVSNSMFEYRTKFVQHMLTSPMYANSVIGKPWEMIGRITEQIIDELLLKCAQEIQLEDVVHKIYKSELC